MQDLDIYNNSYLIIGAPNTKKSEVSMLLSKQLKYKLINLDREKISYFNDFTDYDFNMYQKIKEKYGNIKALNYIHKYEMKHLDYVLNNIEDNVVIDFGNTYTLINDSQILDKLKRFKNIILLESSIVSEDELYNKLKNNKINKILSTIKINIDNKTTEEIIKEILDYKEHKSVL